MPGHEGKIETRCPACGAKYRVPAASEGHHARCPKCRMKFLVAEVERKQGLVDRPYPPTEDDILRWLNEGSDDEFLAARPRIISGKDPDRPESHADETDPAPVVSPVESRTLPSDPLLDSARTAKGLRKTG